jgi:hypothetical protein
MVRANRPLRSEDGKYATSNHVWMRNSFNFETGFKMANKTGLPDGIFSNQNHILGKF